MTCPHCGGSACLPDDCECWPVLDTEAPLPPGASITLTDHVAQGTFRLRGIRLSDGRDFAIESVLVGQMEMLVMAVPAAIFQVEEEDAPAVDADGAMSDRPDTMPPIESPQLPAGVPLRMRVTNNGKSPAHFCARVHRFDAADAEGAVIQLDLFPDHERDLAHNARAGPSAEEERKLWRPGTPCEVSTGCPWPAVAHHDGRRTCAHCLQLRTLG